EADALVPGHAELEEGNQRNDLGRQVWRTHHAFRAHDMFDDDVFGQLIGNHRDRRHGDTEQGHTKDLPVRRHRLAYSAACKTSTAPVQRSHTPGCLCVPTSGSTFQQRRHFSPEARSTTTLTPGTSGKV